ncbi:hypothetical protein [Reichenbachiella sp. MALMAid0571]|uniref:hypothetical protein n=1 Tax=Reichenbachiella sp. MALMAid0571 TaxID=3143939 RepID=UPI0032DEAD23
MKKNKDIQREVNKTLDVLDSIRKVEAPIGIYSSVMDKVRHEEKDGIDYMQFVKWAAIGLLIIMNAISYVSFLNEEKQENEPVSSTETEIENLVSEYQINTFAYSEY